MWCLALVSGLVYSSGMTKIKVVPDGSWEVAEGGRAEYYQVGSWYMELIVDEFDDELASAKQAIKANKAWYRWLKKNRKKYKTP